MEYLVVKSVSWKDFAPKVGAELKVSDLVADGKPIPKAVIDVMIGTGGLQLVVDEDTQLAPE